MLQHPRPPVAKKMIHCPCDPMANKLRTELRAAADDYRRLPSREARYHVWFESDVGLPRVYTCHSAAECILLIDEECNQRGYIYLDHEVDTYDPEDGTLDDVVEHAFRDMEAYIQIDGPDRTSVRFGLKKITRPD